MPSELRLEASCFLMVWPVFGLWLLQTATKPLWRLAAGKRRKYRYFNG
jgi:hypothetical protein